MKIKLKLARAWKFDIYKNVVASIIAMLGCLEVDTEVLNTDIETVRFDNCRKMSRDNKNTNNMLVVI